MSVLRMKPDRKKPPTEAYQRRRFKEWAYRRWGRLDLEKGTGRLLIRIVGSTMSSSEVGWPDIDVFIRHLSMKTAASLPPWPFYKLVMLEWKRTPEDECTAVQLRRHAELRAMGVTVYVIACRADAERALTYEIDGRGH